MIKYGTCDRCDAVCETLHEDVRGRWVCARHAALDGGAATVWLVALFPLLAMIVWFIAATAGMIAGTR